MQKSSTSKTLRQLALGSPFGSSSKPLVTQLYGPKKSLASSEQEMRSLRMDSSMKLEKKINRSTQLGSSPSAHQINRLSKRKGFQDMMTKSEVSVSVFRGQSNAAQKSAKLKMDDRFKTYNQSVYMMGHSPKASALNGKLSGCRPGSKEVSGKKGVSGTHRKPAKELVSYLNNFVGEVERESEELRLQDQVQESLGNSSSQILFTREDKDKPIFDKEENMPTTRPISSEDLKQPAFKNTLDKKRCAITVTAALSSSTQAKSGKSKWPAGGSNIAIHIPKKYQFSKGLQDSRLDFKSFGATSSRSKIDIRRMTSNDLGGSKKEVSPSIQKRVNVIKESPLVPFSSTKKKSVFFPVPLDKRNDVKSSIKTGQSKPI